MKEDGNGCMFDTGDYESFYNCFLSDTQLYKYIHVSALFCSDEIIATHWGAIYRNRFYYSILRNTNMLYNEYDSSFEYFLKKSICSDNPGISWKKLSEITIEEWNQIKPWKKLFGIAEDIFFYILRDIKDFKDTKYLKLDKRNLSYFNKKELWCIAGDKVQKNNKTAYEILEKINSKIKKKNPEWPYSIGHLNAAIYAENL